METAIQTAGIEATDELYRKCERTIDKACFDAWRKNPIIDLDDYRSYADEIFMDSVKSYDDSKGTKFNTWLTTQLLRLKKYAGRFKMVTKFDDKPESLVLSADRHLIDSGDRKQCSPYDRKTSFMDFYSASISMVESSKKLEDMLDKSKYFIEWLSPDAKTLMKDIVDGDAARRDSNGLQIPEKRNVYYSKLTPRQLFVRLHRKRGWSFERVRSARAEIENMLRECGVFYIPDPEPVDGKQEQDELF